jgi:hypothetical protein
MEGEPGGGVEDSQTDRNDSMELEDEDSQIVDQEDRFEDGDIERADAGAGDPDDNIYTVDLSSYFDQNLNAGRHLLY